MSKGIHDLSKPDYLGLKNHLSATGAKRLLTLHFNGCPAKYHFGEDNPQPPKKVFDTGNLAHKLVLGEGDAIEIIGADSWRTKDAKFLRDEARDAGKIPVLTHEYNQAKLMADALEQNPDAMKALRGGVVEKSITWTDEATGVKCKVRPDSMNVKAGIVADYKTTVCASTDKVENAVKDYGYFLQAALYLEGVRAVTDIQDPVFYFIFQEKEAPYLSNVVTLHPHALHRGEQFIAKAKLILAECLAKDVWPGYYTPGQPIQEVQLPKWLEDRCEAFDNEGYFQTARQ